MSFAGSQALVGQVREGVPADLVLLADASFASDLHRARLVREPRVFARSRIVWISALDAGGEPRLRRRDLGRRPARLVLAAPSVPAGAYARRALSQLGQLSAAETSLVSRELDVRGVLTKVAMGEADAGMVYATDARLAADRIWVEELPGTVRVEARYAGAVLARSRAGPHAASWLSRLAGPEGCQVLRRHGFGCAKRTTP